MLLGRRVCVIIRPVTPLPARRSADRLELFKAGRASPRDPARAPGFPGFPGFPGLPGIPGFPGAAGSRGTPPGSRALPADPLDPAAPWDPWAALPPWPPGPPGSGGSLGSGGAWTLRPGPADPVAPAPRDRAAAGPGPAPDREWQFITPLFTVTRGATFWPPLDERDDRALLAVLPGSAALTADLAASGDLPDAKIALAELDLHEALTVAALMGMPLVVAGLGQGGDMAFEVFRIHAHD